MERLAFVLLASTLVAACASGGEGGPATDASASGEGGVDADVPDPSSDGGIDDAGEPDPIPDAGPDGGTCEPSSCETLPAACGDHDDGCGGTLACGTCPAGSDCVEGACGCSPDSGEPNENRLTPHELSPFSDAPDTAMTFDSFGLHAASDEDWFRFAVSDDFDSGNPQLTVRLEGIPSGSDYELTVWYACDSGGDDSSCTRGTPDNMIGNGCTSATAGSADETVEIDTNCSGADDSGKVYVRITSTTWTASCASYRVFVDVR